MATFALQILTTIRVPEEKQVTAIEAPGARGRLTVMAGHVPMVCALEPGSVRIVLASGVTEHWYLDTKGLLIVSAEGVTLMSKQPMSEFRPEA
jgi:F0F1-type ATP synthase epsilon subunit